jgi:hypothetical protein
MDRLGDCVPVRQKDHLRSAATGTVSPSSNQDGLHRIQVIQRTQEVFGRTLRRGRDIVALASVPHPAHLRRAGSDGCGDGKRAGLADGSAGTGVTAIRALRMQKDQLQVGHTNRPSDSVRRALKRPPCYHKVSVAAYL